MNIEILQTGNTPQYARPGDAGADLSSSISVALRPGHRLLIPTGTAVAIPAGYAGFVVPRSGLAFKHGITIVNSPGTIDSGYRGELKVCLLNTDTSKAFEIHKGDRIAQLVISPVVNATFVPVSDLPDSARGSDGFGSTGYSDIEASDFFSSRDAEALSRERFIQPISVTLRRHYDNETERLRLTLREKHKLDNQERVVYDLHSRRRVVRGKDLK